MNHPIQRLIDTLGGTQAKAAEKMRVSQAHLSYLLNNQRRVSIDFALKAEIASNGVIKRSELLPELFGNLTE